MVGCFLCLRKKCRSGPKGDALTTSQILMTRKKENISLEICLQWKKALIAINLRFDLKYKFRGFGNLNEKIAYGLG